MKPLPISDVTTEVNVEGFGKIDDIMETYEDNKIEMPNIRSAIAREVSYNRSRAYSKNRSSNILGSSKIM